MKKIITKSITVITIMVMVLTLAVPVTVQAKAKPKLNKTAITLNVKKSYQLKVNGTKKKVTWKTSNTKVAAVSKTGKVTAKKQGKAVVTAKVSGKTYKCRVTVKAALKVGLNKTKVALSIYETKSYQLKVNGTKAKVTWKTSNAKVAVVSKTGKVTAKKQGKAVITAKAGGKTYKCSVTVSNKHKCVWKEHYKTVPIQTWHGTKRKVYVSVCSCGLVFEGDEWGAHNAEMSFAQELGVLSDLTKDYWKRTPEEFDTFLNLCKKQGEQHSCAPGDAEVGDYYTIDGYEEFMNGKYCEICGDFTGEWWRWD